jgi:hypothetical protein
MRDDEERTALRVGAVYKPVPALQHMFHFPELSYAALLGSNGNALSGFPARSLFREITTVPELG